MTRAIYVIRRDVPHSTPDVGAGTLLQGSVDKKSGESIFEREEGGENYILVSHAFYLRGDRPILFCNLESCVRNYLWGPIRRSTSECDIHDDSCGFYRVFSCHMLATMEAIQEAYFGELTISNKSRGRFQYYYPDQEIVCHFLVVK